MEYLSIVATILGAIGTVFGIYSATKNNKRTDAKDSEEAGQRFGQMMAELGYIRGGIDDTKRKIEKLEANYFDVLQRLTVVEQSVKSAHKRLDDLGAKHYPDKQ